MIRDPIAPLRTEFHARLRKDSPQNDVAPAESTQATSDVAQVRQPRVRRAAHIPESESAAPPPNTRRYGDQGLDVVGDSLPDLLDRINRRGAEVAIREQGPNRVQIASLRRRMMEGPGLVARLRVTEGRLAVPTTAKEISEAQREQRKAVEEAVQTLEERLEAQTAARDSAEQRSMQRELTAVHELWQADAAVRREHQREGALEDTFQAAAAPDMSALTKPPAPNEVGDSRPHSTGGQERGQASAIAPRGSLVDIVR